MHTFPFAGFVVVLSVFMQQKLKQFLLLFTLQFELMRQQPCLCTLITYMHTSATHANLIHDVTDTALSVIKSKMVMCMAVLITFECQCKMAVLTLTAVFTSEPVWPSGKALG